MTSRPRRGLVAVVLVAVALAGCAQTPATHSSQATIQLMLFGDPVETAGYNKLIDAFEQQNGDVRVNLVPVAEQDELLAKLTTSFAGGKPPDTFLVNYRSYGQFADQGVLAPVQPFLDQSDAISEDEFAPTALEAFRFDGRQLTCMPQNVSSLEVYYNVDLFTKAKVDPPTAGWTWDDFLAAAKATTSGDTYGVGVEASLIRLAPFVWSAGGEMVDNPDDPATLALDEPAARKGLDFFLDLQLVHKVAPPEKQELSLDAESRFLAGKLAMYLDSRKAVPGLRTIESFEWDVAPLPVAPGGKPATILHGDAYCISQASQHKDAAWQFIEFAMGAEGQRVLAESGRTVPSRLDVASSDAFLEPEQPPASSKVFVDAIPHIRSVPHTATWSQVEKEGDNVLAAMFYGRVDRERGLQQLIESTRPLFAKR